MKSYSSREIIKLLKKDGWYEVHCVGDHHQFKHPTKKGARHRHASAQRLPPRHIEKHRRTSRHRLALNQP